ncbi:odorant-binding protein-like [Pteronotus mesoamericanus]|uniref:odorant-binding protein-like n=1 Tax=Pteronotus mesoamericanus TaxID=1884717 RepID=UPI0023EB62BC|nr:odorant-binding protein-like [Pteronotus parnellii mesoamericanus]
MFTVNEANRSLTINDRQIHHEASHRQTVYEEAKVLSLCIRQPTPNTYGTGTNQRLRMKVLLLTLLLSLVCANLSTTDLSQFSGEWKSLYVASNNPMMTNENGPFLCFNREINFERANNNISFDYFLKVNGECVQQYLPGTRIEGNVFTLNYEGITLYKLTYASETSLVGYFINVDENNEVSIITMMYGKSYHVNELGFEKFKELTREKNIPQENIVDYANLEDCSKN